MSGMSPTELENLPDPETTLDTDAWKLIEQAGFELSNLIGPLSYWKIEDSSGNPKTFADDQEQTRKVKETVSQGFDDETILYVITDPKELEGNPILNDPNYKRLRMLFRKVLDENREKFKDQLTKAGFQELTQIVEKVDKLKKDPVYADFNLYVRSYKEPKLYGILREDFNLNPVPFETNIKMPNEYPWGNTIKTDFLMPVDVLVQSGKELTIKRKIVFTGEYLEGRKNSKDRQILESEKPYVGPDGKPHQFTTDIAGMSISQNMARGKSILDIEAYNAKTEWKKVVQPVVSSLLGGSSLYFVEEDTNPPYEKIAKKLDDHYIIYSYAGCSDETCKAMNLLKKSAQANPNSESAEYINNPQKFDTKRKQLDYLEIMKANFLITAVFPRSIQLTTSKSFNTGSMYEHYLYLQKLNEEENALFQRYDPNNEQIVSRLEEIHRQKDSLENSPLYDIKQKFDDLKTSKRYARVLENFDYLADIVKNSEISDVDLRVKVNDLINGINVSSIRSFAERVRLIKKYASS
jgi:hypothetical protein